MKLGSDYGAYARVPLCPACGNPYIPPGYGGHCSPRCIRYVTASRHPVLGDPLFGPQQNMLCRGGCGVRFDSRGIVLCVDCWERSRSDGSDALAGGHAARHDDPIIDRLPRSRCHW